MNNTITTIVIILCIGLLVLSLLAIVPIDELGEIVIVCSLILLPIAVLGVLISWLSEKLSEARKDKTAQTDEQMTVLCALENPAQAGAIKSLLESHNIPCLIDSFEEHAYDGLWALQKGWGRLKVFEKDKATVQELLNKSFAGKVHIQVEEEQPEETDVQFQEESNAPAFSPESDSALPLEQDRTVFLNRLACLLRLHIKIRKDEFWGTLAIYVTMGIVIGAIVITCIILWSGTTIEDSTASIDIQVWCGDSVEATAQKVARNIYKVSKKEKVNKIVLSVHMIHATIGATLNMGEIEIDAIEVRQYKDLDSYMRDNIDILKSKISFLEYTDRLKGAAVSQPRETELEETLHSMPVISPAGSGETKWTVTYKVVVTETPVSPTRSEGVESDLKRWYLKVEDIDSFMKELQEESEKAKNETKLEDASKVR